MKINIFIFSLFLAIPFSTLCQQNNYQQLLDISITSASSFLYAKPLANIKLDKAKIFEAIKKSDN